MNKQPIEINSDFKYALNVLDKTNESVFLTGRAGTGKSTLLRLFRKTTKKKIIVLAPTGLAYKGKRFIPFLAFRQNRWQRAKLSQERTVNYTKS
jgi:ATP-dependent DNA helicase PIF1